MLFPDLALPEAATKFRRASFVAIFALTAALVGLAVREIGLPGGLAAGFLTACFLSPWLHERFFATRLTRAQKKQSYTAAKLWLVAFLCYLAIRGIFSSSALSV
jgi:hypothetical protein